MTRADLLAEALRYPLLVQRLAELHRAGWSVQVCGWGRWEAGATDHDHREIRICMDAHEPVAVLAHEVGHARSGRPKFTFGPNRDDFEADNVRAMLLEEAAADVCALEVRDDALTRGLPDPGPSAVDPRRVWARFKAGELTRAALLDRLADLRIASHADYYRRQHRYWWARVMVDGFPVEQAA